MRCSPNNFISEARLILIIVEINHLQNLESPKKREITLYQYSYPKSFVPSAQREYYSSFCINSSRYYYDFSNLEIACQ